MEGPLSSSYVTHRCILGSDLGLVCLRVKGPGTYLSGFSTLRKRPFSLKGRFASRKLYIGEGFPLVRLTTCCSKRGQHGHLCVLRATLVWWSERLGGHRPLGTENEWPGLPWRIFKRTEENTHISLGIVSFRRSSQTATIPLYWASSPHLALR
jgi:hypothetical protein